jgi:hypothetical protein
VLLSDHLNVAKATSVLHWLIPGFGVGSELLVLLRGVRAHLLGTYHFFYTYIASIAVGSVALAVMLAIGASPEQYQRWYWPLQLITLVTGYGILLEIFNHVLAPYPGAAKFARFAGVGSFAAIFCFALIAPLVMPHQSRGTIIEFERDLRCVQALFICVLLAVISYYGVGIGKNIKGMVFGYGLYILTSLISLAVRAYAGPSFDAVWDIVQPLSFDTSLLIWVVALWSYCPNPVPDSSIHLEEDYEALVARTKSAMGVIRAYIGKAAGA